MNKCPWCNSISDEDRWPLCNDCGYALINHYYILVQKEIITKDELFDSVNYDE